MNLTLLLLASALPQEPSELRGIYRGPYDEVLVEQAASVSIQPGVLFDGWERWEFWFEHERGLLLSSGAQSNPAVAASFLLHEEEVLNILGQASEDSDAGVREAAALAWGRLGVSESAASLLCLSQDSNTSVRQAGLLGLGLADPPGGLRLLADRFRNANAPLADRCFAAIGLGLTQRDEARLLLQDSLRRNMHSDRLFGDDETLLQAVIWAAGLHGSRQLLPVLLQGAERLSLQAGLTSRRIRSQLCWTLAGMGDFSARPWLTRQLTQADISLRRSAALAFGRLGDRSAISLLAEQLKTESDLQTKMNLLFSLGRIGGPEAAHALMEFDEQGGQHRQLRAAWGIASGMAHVGENIELLYGELLQRDQRDPWAGNDLPNKLRRDEERLRAGFALALGFSGDPRNIEALAATTEAKGIGADYLGYASVALGMLGGDQAEEALLRLARTSAQEVDSRRGLALGLGLIGGTESRSFLAEMLLHEREPSVRRAAAWAFGRAADRGSVQRLVQMWGQAKENCDAQAAIVEALGQVAAARKASGLELAVSGREHRLESRLGRALASY